MKYSEIPYQMHPYVSYLCCEHKRLLNSQEMCISSVFPKSHMPQKEESRDGRLGRCRPRVLFLKATAGLNQFHAETNSWNTRGYGDRHSPG